MDIKDLIAKITGKNKEAKIGSSKKKNSISMFFERNPKMKYIIAFIAIVVSVAVAVVVAMSYSRPKTDLSTDVTIGADANVDVLPELERDVGDKDYNGRDPFNENVLDAAKLTGIYDFYGYKTATLQTSVKSYTLREGDSVGDSEWIVSEITENSITIVSGDKTKIYKK